MICGIFNYNKFLHNPIAACLTALLYDHVLTLDVEVCDTPYREVNFSTGIGRDYVAVSRSFK